ncbi:MAG: cell division protein FtsQ [Lachnospiraceae bacterium]|jgi:cell division protein FtsQ|nr:cell division protein FtsQ [Lachnospiraceae bacterium]
MRSEHAAWDAESGNERDTIRNFFRQRKSLFVIALSIMMFGFIAWSGYRYLIDNFTVTKIHVHGNVQYGNDEIIEMVMRGRYGNNSLFLSWWYKDRSIDDVPFIEKMDVTILERDTIRINVYEKAVAGYVEFLGHYLYFDKDGIIVETATERRAEIPEVIGLRFDYAVKHARLPIRDNSIFQTILTIRHLSEQFNIPADRIFFGDSNEVTLLFDDIRVALGNEGRIDDKIMALENILPSLIGRRGILRMEHYDEFASEVIFESS